MQPERFPLTKIFDAPFLSLDGSSVEMASILFLFLVVIAISQVSWRRQLIRRLVQAISVFFFFCVVYSCLGVFGMIRNSLFGLTLIGSAYTESFYWMALPVVVLSVTFISGPVFCGWICPTGTLQDISGWLRKYLLPENRGALTQAGRIALAGFVLAFLSAIIWLSIKKQMFIEDSSLHWAAALLLLCYLVLAGVLDDRPTRALRLLSLSAVFFTAISHLVITSPVHFAFTSRSDPASALATVVIMVAALFVTRSWCRYLCPWGYLMGFMHRFSRVRIEPRPGLCTDCGTCAKHCDVGAISHGRVAIEHCQFCYACVDACPTKAFEVVDIWQPRAGAGNLANTTRERATHRLPMYDQRPAHAVGSPPTKEGSAS